MQPGETSRLDLSIKLPTNIIIYTLIGDERAMRYLRWAVSSFPRAVHDSLDRCQQFVLINRLE
jgi:hypothetical protein